MSNCETAIVAAPPPPTTPAPAPATPAAATALAPGFRFHPTDEELVRYYLTRKVCGRSFRFDAIAEADIYKMEPWDLPALSRLRSRDLEWYFFSALDKKYENGVRMNRATLKGYWKTTGKDRAVKHDSRIVGMKKTLVFHQGRAPGGMRTNWVMHEYRLADAESERAGVMKYGYVLCRVFQKSCLGPPNGDQFAPFIDDEWDDDHKIFIPSAEGADEVVVAVDRKIVLVPSTEGADEVVGADDHKILIPGTEGADEVVGADNHKILVPSTEGEGADEVTGADEPEARDSSFVEANGHEQPPPLKITEPEKLILPQNENNLCNLSFHCKSERLDDWPLPSIVRNKRPRSSFTYPSQSTASKSSSTATTDLSLSITSTTTAAEAAVTTAAQTLLEFPHIESTIGPKESPSTFNGSDLSPKDAPATPPRKFDIATFDMSVHPSYLDLINNLQREIHTISNERDRLRIEVMSAETMMNILQSRINYLITENEKLKMGD